MFTSTRAGDISNHHEQASLPFLEQVRQHLDVSYNLGNHDMLGLDEAQIEAENFQILDIGQRQLLAFHELFVRYQIPDVVFGHAHRSYGTVEIDGVRYHASPLGYQREWDLTIDFVNQNPHLNPSQTWNLSKRFNLVKNNPLYQAHKKEKFKDELLGSMSLFEVG